MSKDDRLLTSREFAEFARLNRDTPAVWRCRGEGPPYCKFNGRIVRYRMRDVLAWMDSQTIKPKD